MEAANRGAYEAGGTPLQVLASNCPHEQGINLTLVLVCAMPLLFHAKTMFMRYSGRFDRVTRGMGTPDELLKP